MLHPTPDTVIITPADAVSAADALTQIEAMMDVQSRLKHYTLPCSGGGANGAPDVVEFAIDRATAQTILNLAAIARTHTLLRIERAYSGALWLDDEDDQIEATVELVSLNIGPDSFWLSCHRKGSGNAIESATLDLTPLATHFALPLPTAPTTPPPSAAPRAATLIDPNLEDAPDAYPS
ncbi:hypothetical protein [Azospirillum canadense]|uniref:hypothetical protein n=1 Tax=Azospirillum canadense TaxID=403962 RepID=UPI002227BE06|nr:hypothetical protein [Azospirillum canadense]MCW2240750.1 hypothetical protein [Azospirillum canadense]